jgi:hypothetical protein
MNNQTYTAEQVKDMLGKSMAQFQKSMVQIIRECAEHETYAGLNAHDALQKVANRLEKLK